MDDVLADFYSATWSEEDRRIQEEKMWNKDFFMNLKPIKGSQGSVYLLGKMGFDLRILSQPLAESPESYMDKAKWVGMHFPQLYKSLILTQDKSLHIGDYLIDDNLKKWKEKFERNGGKFVHFPYGGYNRDYIMKNPEKLWKDVVRFFETQNPEK
jgi:5'(3')-deoxyribonucleotidase